MLCPHCNRRPLGPITITPIKKERPYAGFTDHSGFLCFLTATEIDNIRKTFKDTLAALEIAKGFRDGHAECCIYQYAQDNYISEMPRVWMDTNHLTFLTIRSGLESRKGPDHVICYIHEG